MTQERFYNALKRRPTSAETLTQARQTQHSPGIHNAQTTATNGLAQPPLGSVIAYAGATDPDEWWMVADGRPLSRVDYQPLFELIGTTYNEVGDSASIFRIPDLRGRAPIGAGQGPGLTNRELGDYVGEEAHALTDEENGPHNHGGATGSGSHTHTDHFHSAQSAQAASGSGRTVLTELDHHFLAGGETSITLPIPTDGAGTPHNNVGPSVVLNQIIRVRDPQTA